MKKAFKQFSIVAAVLIFASTLLSASTQSSTPEKTVKDFYLAYCKSSAEMQLNPSKMKKYITARLYNKIEKDYKDNPASDGDRYTFSSGDNLKSIKEVVLSNISKDKTSFSANVSLQLEDGALNLNVKLVKEKNVWKINSITQ